jgi:thiol:disulfide interchange protein DsbD
LHVGVLWPGATEFALSRAAALPALRGRGNPKTLDFYADWCTACKEMERETFTDAGVQHKLQDFTLLRTDVTANSPAQRELQKRFGLFGPPGLIFFDPKGQELSAWRVNGFMAPDKFQSHLTRAAAHGARSL